jgi:plasmid stabilization system protein ParE
MGESVEQLQRGVRRVTLGSYQLFYEQTSDGIRLLRVYHAARRIEDLFSS